MRIHDIDNGVLFSRDEEAADAGAFMQLEFRVQGLNCLYGPSMISPAFDENVDVLGGPGSARPTANTVGPGQNERDLLLCKGRQDLIHVYGRSHVVAPELSPLLLQAKAFV